VEEATTSKQGAKTREERVCVCVCESAKVSTDTGAKRASFFDGVLSVVIELFSRASPESPSGRIPCDGMLASEPRLPTEEDAGVLTVVLDCSPSWARRAPDEHAAALEHLLLLLNAYSLHAANSQLAVLGTHSDGVEVFWPPKVAGPDAVAAPSDPQALRAAIADGVCRHAAHKPGELKTKDGSPRLSAALTASLCRMQRVCRAQPKARPRLLVIHASADSRSQHLACMNCAFACRRLGVLVDVVQFGPSDSMALQQAAHMTGGLYLRPDAPTLAGLAQYLITCVLPDRYARQFLASPLQDEPDTRARCYITGKPIEIGWACSVCLSVFEHDGLPSCPACASRFSLAPLGPLPKKRAKKGAKPGAAAGPPAQPAALPRQAAAVPGSAAATTHVDVGAGAPSMAAWQTAPAPTF
jgi:transcription initiation factor TFIIH subunit 3